MKTALITGITGQDGSYLAKLLLSNGYNIVGLVRDISNPLDGLRYLGVKNEVEIVLCDLLDKSQILSVITQYKPCEIYNLAAQSSVFQSYNDPIGTFQFNTISVFNLVEAIKISGLPVRFYQASSSEMFGRVANLPITETSLIHPLSPYAISKVAAHYTCVNYRESYGMYICCGILFNHESYLRSNDFFVKKVIRQSIAISMKRQETLQVGNIEIKRDFGYAPKYVEAMYLMLQQEIPSDYLVCSGASVSLKEIIYYVFGKLGISEDRCIVNEKFYRPSDIADIYGNNEKAKKELDWEYNYNFFGVLDLLIAEELKNSILY